jgi:quercetin dioxygenase-like cupin family protein
MELLNKAEADEEVQVEGLRKKVLIDGKDGARNALRRFVLEPNATVPRHRNQVEHVQYVLEGGYTVEVEGKEHTAEEGDALHVPAGAVHSYEAGGDGGVFLCVVPDEKDEIEVID